MARDIHQDKEAVKRMIRFLKDAEKEHIEYIKRDKLKPEDVRLHYYGDELTDDSKLLVDLFKPRDGIVLQMTFTDMPQDPFQILTLPPIPTGFDAEFEALRDEYGQEEMDLVAEAALEE